ncbi:MAG: hypothetical protein WA709_16120, partial [Stellaceae bacterium]
LTFPEFRLLREHFVSIVRSPLTAAQKVRCYSTLLIWIRWHLKFMLKDLVIAADQVLYNMQVAKTGINRFSALREPAER